MVRLPRTTSDMGPRPRTPGFNELRTDAAPAAALHRRDLASQN
jgi:hypothetical protein